MRVSLLIFFLTFAMLLNPSFQAKIKKIKSKLVELNLEAESVMHNENDLKRVILTNRNNQNYLMRVQLGLAQNEFTVKIDTGSSDMLIPYYKCVGCSHDISYFCQTSSTCFTDTSYVLRKKNSYGTAEGFQSYDQLKIASNFYIPRQSFIALTRITGRMAKDDGSLGLAVNNVGMTHNPSFLSNLLEYNKLNSHVFSLFLSTDEARAPSQLIFGGFDNKFIKNDTSMFWLNITNGNFYGATFQHLNIDLNQIKPSQNEILFNSGNDYITLPKKIVTQLLRIFKTKYKINCHASQNHNQTGFSLLSCLLHENSLEFPSLNLEIEEGYFPIQAKDYIEYCRGMKTSKNVTCLTKIEVSDSVENIIMGLPFHQAYYFVCDLEKRKMGLGEAINENSFKVYHKNGTFAGNVQKSSQVFDLLKEKEPEGNSNFIIIALVVLGVVILSLVLLAYFYKVYKNKKMIEYSLD